LIVQRFIKVALCVASLVIWQTSETQASDDASMGVGYSVEIGGVEGRLETLVRQSSQLVTLRDRLPTTPRALNRRINNDVSRFRAVLESEGFYAGSIDSSTDFNSKPAQVRIQIETGPRYSVAALQPQPEETFDQSKPNILTGSSVNALLAKIIGRPARAEDVISAEQSAISEVQNSGYPFAQAGIRQVDVDHEARQISITLPVRLGSYALHGETQFSGYETVKESYLQKLVPWETGSEFSVGALEDYRRSLVNSGLFTSVRVFPFGEEEHLEGAPLDVDVEIDEAAHRTIGAGAKYGRDRGFGGSVFWEHRNFFGEAEKLRLSLDGTELDQTVSAEFRKPNFISLNQTLILGSEVKHADTDAFREWSGNLSAALERELGAHWTVSAGTTFEVASLTEDGFTRTSYLAGLPLSAIYDVSNDVLDPTNGWSVSAGVTPYAGSFDGSVFFAKSEVEGNVYVPFSDRERIVFAARLALGSIAGSATDQVPANRRFYAGGGGSVRGFGYQLVGPLDGSDEPTGGRSLIEASVETRIKVGNSIGVVPFFDAGLVSLSSLPGDGGKIRTAAGIGARYYTDVGPLRLDIAIPINRRPGIDKSFQFYISFGQAF